MKEVHIFGAGFSGLSLAYYLNKLGLPVFVHEKESRVGGLLNSVPIKESDPQFGFAETAANGFLDSLSLQEMFADLNIQLQLSSQTSRNRFIFTERPARWPLSFGSSVQFIFFVVLFLFKPQSSRRPAPQESIQAWWNRHFPSAGLSRLVEPALRGIYAGDVQKLSASLILAPFFNRKKHRLKKKSYRSRGLVSGPRGMGPLMNEIAEKLRSRGVQIQTGSSWSPELQASIEAKGAAIVIATSASTAAEILAQIPQAYKITQILSQIEMLPVVTVTAFPDPANQVIRGFGVLFSRLSPMKALGVLFNEFIFPRGFARPAETWILGGASRPDIIQASDREVLQIISQDRAQLMGTPGDIQDYRITRWPKAFPHYTVGLEQQLNELKLYESELRGIYLHGNYLGRLGLTRILERSGELADLIFAKISQGKKT